MLDFLTDDMLPAAPQHLVVDAKRGEHPEPGHYDVAVAVVDGDTNRPPYQLYNATVDEIVSKLEYWSRMHGGLPIYLNQVPPELRDITAIRFKPAATS
jgi:hypothetical protein